MRPEGLAVVFLATEGSVSSEFRARLFHEFALNFVAPLGFKFSFDYHIFVCLVAHWRTARKNGKIQERAQETKGQGNCLVRRKGQIKAGTWKEHVIAMSRPRWYWESLTQAELDFSPLACLCLNCSFFQSRWLCFAWTLCNSVQLFWQDLSKKDAALLKFGRELKELETVQEQLEKKDQELRIEKNRVSFACLFFVVILYI